jgi:DNA polymerase-1
MAFARLVRGEDRRPETKSKIITNSVGLSRLCQLLATVETPIAFDVETWSTDPDEDEGGLNPWSPNGGILTVSFTWEQGKSYVVALEHPENHWDIPIARVYDALNVALTGKKMVGHNVKFDATWMKVKGVHLYSHFDTKAAAHLLDENRPQGLKPLARTYLGADNYEEGIVWRSGQAPPLRKLAIYNGKDTDYTFRLYHIFKDELQKQPRVAKLFTRLLMPATRAFVDFELHGFPVDMDRLERRHRSILRKIAQVNDAMMEMVPEELQSSANFRSPMFLGRWFFEHLHLPIPLFTPTGKPSTAESALLQLVDKHPAVKMLMELRKWQKNESTYTRNWLARIAIAGKPRLYTSYNLTGTVTGRLSSNMQQVPRDVYIRGIIGSESGWRFIEADFSQIELRLAAMLSRDPALTKAFRTGGDPHRETASKILRKAPEEISKEERKMAKAVNFGFLYGMGWRKFAVYADEKYQTKVTDEEAKAYRKAFFEQYPSLESWHARQRRIVRNVGAVTSPIGRVRHLPAINSTDEGVQAEAEREAINSPVQGFASDLTVLSMVILAKKLDPNRSRILGNVHDAILLEATEDYADEAARITKYVMEHLPLKKLFGYKSSVPIEAEVTIGQHWGEH